MPSRVNLTDKVFGHLKVLEESDLHRGRTAWLCMCLPCGVVKKVWTRHLVEGRVVSCGSCFQTEHGESFGENKTPEYRAWNNAKQRCRPEHKQHADYHDRGIHVWPEWNRRDGYLSFLAHVGRRPTDLHSLDRIDNDRGYEPGNLRWATRDQQNDNKRKVQLLCAEVKRLQGILDEHGITCGR